MIICENIILILVVNTFGVSFKSASAQWRIHTVDVVLMAAMVPIGIDF